MNLQAPPGVVGWISSPSAPRSAAGPIASAPASSTPGDGSVKITEETAQSAGIPVSQYGNLSGAPWPYLTFAATRDSRGLSLLAGAPCALDGAYRVAHAPGAYSQKSEPPST